MDTLLSGLELREPLAQVRHAGAAFVRRALTGSRCEQLRREVSGVAFETANGRYGPRRVRQESDVFVTADFGPHPQLRRLRDELEARVHAAAPDMSRWRPDEVSIQRYRPGAVGITPHLDHKRYRYLVASFTVEGEAAFTLCRNREGDAIATWRAGPGSLVLLRGPGLDGLDDGRPLHAVGGPRPTARGSRWACGWICTVPAGTSPPSEGCRRRDESRAVPELNPRSRRARLRAAGAGARS